MHDCGNLSCSQTILKGYSWSGNEAIHAGLGMRLFMLVWERGYLCWSGNEAIHGLGTRLFVLVWE